MQCREDDSIYEGKNLKQNLRLTNRTGMPSIALTDVTRKVMKLV